MGNIFTDLKSLLYTDIVRRRKVTPVIIMLSFIISFLGIRLITIFFPNSGIILNGYRIHHFYFGIVLLAIVGWVVLVSDKERLLRLAAISYGVGLGLLTDEMGLLLTCSSDGFVCNYYARQSYDAAIIIILLFLNAIYIIPFLKRFKKGLRPLVQLLLL